MAVLVLRRRQFSAKPRAEQGFVVTWRTERVLKTSKESHHHLSNPLAQPTAVKWGSKDVAVAVLTGGP